MWIGVVSDDNTPVVCFYACFPIELSNTARFPMFSTPYKHRTCVIIPQLLLVRSAKWPTTELQRSGVYHSFIKASLRTHNCFSIWQISLDTDSRFSLSNSYQEIHCCAMFWKEFNLLDIFGERHCSCRCQTEVRSGFRNRTPEYSPCYYRVVESLGSLHTLVFELTDNSETVKTKRRQQRHTVTQPILHFSPVA